MPLPKKIHYCVNCQKLLNDRHSKFCNSVCFNAHRTQSLIAQWLRGELLGHDAHESIRSFVRKYLYQTRGEKCEQCGWCVVHPTLGYSPLTIDHIDGNPRNSRIDNLRILCPNCHALTNTYGALNKGSGRTTRYKRV